MNELHLFAGTGGGILGGMLLGHRTVCAVEIEPFCRKVLLQRQRDGILPWFPIWDDVKTFDGRPWNGIADLVCGGFPCQDISCAGKGVGITGERSGLWKEMARIIGEVRPRYVFVENVPMLIRRGLAVVLSDLAELGYDARWGVVGADDVGAPHRRKRVWILANCKCLGREERTGKGIQPQKQITERQELNDLCEERSTMADSPQQQDDGRNGRGMDGKEGSREGIDAALDAGREDVANACNTGLQGEEQPGTFREMRQSTHESISECGGLWWSSDPADIPDAIMHGSDGTEGNEAEQGSDGKNNGLSVRNNQWGLESRVGRVVNGVAHRVDRLKALGNGQVPQVVATAWEILIEGR